MNCLIYVRVSTKEQAKQGYSLEAQEKACRAFAFNNGYEIDRVFTEEGESAKTQDRTQLQHLIKYSIVNKKKLSALIVWKLDRLARNLSDQIELMKGFSLQNIRVLSVLDSNEENSTGNLMRNIVGAFSQYENEVKAERTISGMRQAVEKGRWCWRAPTGYKTMRDTPDKKSIQIPTSESPYIVEAFDLFQTGLHTQAEIVQILKKRGFTRINKGLLNRILRNPFYAGLMRTKWYPDHKESGHKAIISKEVFFKVQQLLDGKRPSVTPKLRNHPDFPLRNFVRCPKCGQKLTAGWSTGRKKARYAYYHCRTKGCSLNVPKNALEGVFYTYLKGFQPTQDALAMFEVIVLDVWKNKQQEQIKERDKIEQALKELQARKDKIFDLMIKDAVDSETYKEKTAEVSNEIMVKKIELNEVGIELGDIEMCLNYCKFIMGNIADLWLNADLTLKQRFQTLVFPDKIYFEGETFRNTATASIFKQLQQKSLSESCLASPPNFNWKQIFQEMETIYQLKELLPLTT